MARSSAVSLNFDQRTGDTGDPSNKLHLVDKKNTKSDIWKYIALRVNEDDKVVDYLIIYLCLFISLLLNQRFSYFNAQL